MLNKKFDYPDAKPLRRMKVVCHGCDHRWTTISDAVKVTCPSCNLKTFRIKFGGKR